MADIPKYYPPLGFHFRVSFTGATNATDTYFQSVSGLSVQIQTETWKEGGENRFEHTLPVRTKYSDLVLKRGLFRPKESVWTDWFSDTIALMSASSSERKQSQFTRTRDLLIELLNEKHEPLARWTVAHAWPKNWKINDLNAERSEVLIESLELNYNYFTYDRP
ncbi:phage tail protein [Spirosoma validum]|uniref:Phage tail protein n=1 Tax=Spirosoma validum TaxID=2771355 RepID=A0A927B0B6_9BACT|nr:phage tail protein [Spirosoma validum]MBD2753200.1 phage tail protein [Spirosoma validum]